MSRGTVIAVLNTCAVPLRRRMVEGELVWCYHEWHVTDCPTPTRCTVECSLCGFSLSVPTEFLQGRLKE